MKKLISITTMLIMLVSAQAQWLQIGADIDGEALGDFSGLAVSLNANGTIVAIGAFQNDGNGMGSGHVRVFENESGNWVQVGQDIDGEHAGDRSGYSVSLNSTGSVLAIGARQNSDGGYAAGHVRIYQNLAGTWTQLGEDIDGVQGGQAGESISLNDEGTMIAIGADLSDSNGEQAGQVNIFSYIDQSWIQTGNTLYGENSSDRFGHTVCLNDDGSVLAVGVPGINDMGTVYAYELIDEEWTQMGDSIVDKGHELSMNAAGSIIAIAQPGFNSQTGRVVVYEKNNDQWLPLGNEIVAEATGDFFGTSVDISADGTTIAVGAESNSGNGEIAGHVRAFKLLGDEWTQVGDDIDGEAAGDRSGTSVSLSADGSVLAVGAPWNAENELNAGHVRIFEYNTTAITAQVEQDNIVVFPNPTHDVINIKCSNTNLEKITIRSIQGRAKFNKSKPVHSSHSFQIDISDFNPGIYILNIETEDASHKRRIVKN